MADAVPAMHKDFPRWHAALAVGADAERREARWAAVHGLAEAADRALVEALVRLAFNTTRHPPAATSLSEIHGAFQEADEAFDPTVAAREIQVYAAACLQLLFEQDTDVGAAAALGVATAAFIGGRTPGLPLDLVGLAEAALPRIADGQRERPDVSMSSAAPKFDVEAALNKARTEPSLEAVTQALLLVSSAAKAALARLASRQADAIESVNRFIRVQDEELQMLWWLTGGCSLDLDCAFSSIGLDAQPLVFAKELADATTSLPGPRSLKALLTRAGLKERRKLTVATAINAAEAGWISGLVTITPSPVTAPLHFAISRQMEAGGGDTWVPNWAAVVGVDGERQVSSLSLAVQFYRERLLALFE